ncbi:unnamed protein product [Schistosoma mattheei]|uniref:3-hydroxyisobutyryl-CoA hydrolase, mitochondrial n=1 Tax=Schistosoma mattheei TaxID=31246 RepID=A0AA85C031_9TREM|nr:unnamed protein product [Schistosoma mattheei]
MFQIVWNLLFNIFVCLYCNVLALIYYLDKFSLSFWILVIYYVLVGTFSIMRILDNSTSFILLLKIKAVISIACRHFRSASCTFNNSDVVLISQHKSCGIITLNRPKVHNSLNLEMLGIIHSKLKDWNHDPSVSLVVIEGSGEKAFCAGGDVRFIASAVQKGSIVAQEFFRKEYQLNHLIGVMTKPYIAILNGITMGGGAGISVHGRYRIATEKTVFAMPETMIGFFPDVGGGYFLPRLPHPGLGLFLALTGYKLSSMNTVWAGIATHFIHSKDVTLRQLQIGSKLSFRDEFKMEYRLSQKMTKNPDFYEGVRACLIDKDNTPKWNPNNLTSVDMNQIQSYFNQLPENDEWRPE